ncbi:hypothetical protein ACQ4PT_034904 [Festuca glaucescens]
MRLEEAEEEWQLSDPEVALRRQLKLRVLGLASLERTIARQRARVAGLKDGDASSQFYRILTSSRRQHNFISTLRVGDRVETELPRKVELATGFFMDLLGSARRRDHGLNFEAVGLSSVDLSSLEGQFTEVEVWDAIKAMPTNKSPGPDGFTWEFYRHCWQVVKDDVMAVICTIWLGHDQGFEVLNEAFITAFIRGRCIQDNFLLVRESAKLLHRKKIPAMLLKIDIAKAFDSIAWPFLLSVLRHRGFGPRWIWLITLFLRSASTSVLVNGCAGSAFLHVRGLRQGDPISPLLFVIAMDVLSAMFHSAEQAGILSDLSVLGLRHHVSLYADDVVIFARPAVPELAALWGVLRCFGCASGLVANPAKSSAAPIRCPDEVLELVSASLPCSVVPLPTSYLGLPLSVRKPRKSELHAVLDRLAAKLPFWKARLLSREGRLVYVQAVLTSSVVYQLMALDLDPWFIKAVDKLRRGFLWAGSADARGGCCMVAWRLVCQPKSLGGLGLHNLRYMNVALQTRWLWLQKTDGAKPWGGLDLQVANDSVALFNASVRIIIGSGEAVLFWEDA